MIMYIPSSNLMADVEEAVDFIKLYSFGTLVSAHNNIPTATHLPFFVAYEKGKLLLKSHFAKANPQWKNIKDTTILAIFSEPHAYISPRHYEKKESVPTWNYLSVHVYGQMHLLTDEREAMSVLEETIDYYEPNYQAQWQTLSESFKHNMVKGIVAFEIEVTDIQGKKKLSQNKTSAEQASIISELSKSQHGSEQSLAAYMKKEQE